MDEFKELREAPTVNITDGIPSEIYIAIGRGRYDDDLYELARDVIESLKESMDALRLRCETAERERDRLVEKCLDNDWCRTQAEVAEILKGDG